MSNFIDAHHTTHPDDLEGNAVIPPKPKTKADEESDATKAELIKTLSTTHANEVPSMNQ